MYTNVSEETTAYVIEVPDDGSSICSRYQLLSCNIWGSEGCEDEYNRLLGCDTAKSYKCVPTFQKNLLPPSSGKSYPDDGDKIRFNIIIQHKTTSGIFSGSSTKILRAWPVFVLQVPPISSCVNHLNNIKRKIQMTSLKSRLLLKYSRGSWRKYEYISVFE
jgi:hypothetical protein